MFFDPSPIIRGLNFKRWTEIDPLLGMIVMKFQSNYNFQLIAVLGGVLRGDLWQQWNLSRAHRGVRRRLHRQPGGAPQEGPQLMGEHLKSNLEEHLKKDLS